MAESRVNLGAGAPGGYSFGIAGYGVRPRVFVEGRQTGRTPSVALPEGSGMPDEYGGRVSYTIPFEEGGEVPRSVGIENSVTITPSIPANDPRSVALGSRLLKQAGFAGDFSSVLKNADPRVVAQVNRIMPKANVAAASTGIGFFVESTTKAI